MPTLPLEFEVYCGKCGAGLCGNCTEGKTPGRGAPLIKVDPCEKCLENAKDEGDTEGYERGLADGEKEGGE
jgi:hypothetical protein